MAGEERSEAQKRREAELIKMGMETAIKAASAILRYDNGFDDETMNAFGLRLELFIAQFMSPAESVAEIQARMKAAGVTPSKVPLSARKAGELAKRDWLRGAIEDLAPDIGGEN